MKLALLVTISVFCVFSGSFAAVRYVAPAGSDSNPGTIAAPYKTLTKGVSSSVAGDTIYVRGGTFAVSSNISISKTGSAGNYLKIWAYPGEQPVFDFATETSSEGISLKGMYTHLRGLEIKNAFHNGINISGHYNIIENCKVHDNRNSGVQMGSSSSTANPSNNLILNVDSYRNYDAPIGGNADGFAIKWNIGTGNVIRGCRAYNNSDDGWDLWMATNSVLIDSCLAFRNAYDSWHQAGFNGNGNGFKLGGNNVATPHTVKNCVSFDNTGNTGRGYDENNNLAGQTLYNCTAYRNKADNFHFTNTLLSGQHVIKNCLSYLGAVSITNATLTTNSWQGFSVGAGDFASLDTAQAVLPRNPDGSLQATTFMHLLHSSSMVNAGVDVGTPYLGSAPDLGAYETSEISQFALTTTAIHGFITKTPGAIQYDSATTVQLTAVPDAGYAFTGWSGDLTGSLNPGSVVMNASRNVTANFALITYNVSSSAGPNGTISPLGVNVIPQGDSVRFNISATGGYHIDSVLVDGVDQGQIATYLFSNVVAGHTIVARFAQNPPNSYLLNVSATNGGVTRTPDAQYYLSGQDVQLTCVPDYGYHFVQWIGDAAGSSNPLTVTMDATKNITAVIAIDSFAVNTSIEGMGSILRAPSMAAYPYNSSVQLVAVPAAGQHFVAWSGDLTGTDDTLDVTVDTVKNITATFATNTYPVVVTLAGSGSVMRNPNQSTVYYGNSIELTATPQIGWTFSGWSGDTVTTNNPISFTVHDTIRTTALFVIQTFAISASSGAHGAIEPSGDVSINYNASKRFTFIPSSGYTVDSVYIDGVLTPDSTIGYTFTSVMASHTIRVTFTATNASVDIISGWNLLSLPVDVPDTRVSQIFPQASSLAYSYVGSYASADSMKPGTGYWVKFPAPESHAFNGPAIPSIQIHLRKGWNIVGSLTGEVNVSTITSTPPGLVTSPWYAYNGSYFQSDLIHSGLAYWVKASDSGTVTLSTLSNSPKAGQIMIVHGHEIPPPPPGVESSEKIIPHSFELLQNFPNPFNPVTTIRYGLPEASSVKIRISSVLGQEVNVVAWGEFSAGYHDVQWDATNSAGHRVASGIYYFVIQATGSVTGATYVKTGRMILAQ